jgi:hypothetical protein
MTAITTEELAAKLDAHRAWLDRGRTGTGRADLTGANLARANLTGADLTGANLARAYLARAYLARANLTGANLTGAYLTGADLIHIGPVGSEGRTIYAVPHETCVMVQAGCWWGTLDELAARIEPGGGNEWRDNADRYRGEYEAAIGFVRSLAAVRGWTA